MRLKNLSVLAGCVVLLGCTTVKDAALAKFHRYDPNEYALTVDLVMASRILPNRCTNHAALLADLEKLDIKADFVMTYLEGRSKNQRMVIMAKDFKSLITDTRRRESMSEFFCEERAKNLIEAASILRQAAGEKPE